MSFKTSPSNDILIRAVSLNHVPSAPAVSWNDSATMQIYANNADIVQSKYRYSPSALSTFRTSHHAEAMGGSGTIGKVKRIRRAVFAINGNDSAIMQMQIVRSKYRYRYSPSASASSTFGTSHITQKR